jgi:very-short-patch-repair endonuclease
VAALKTFLTFAETKQLGVSQRSSLPEQSPFEEAVRQALESAGCEVHSQVGIAGFYIDLAIVDPRQRGRYLLGIECDGATYHSSRSARDRDRLRQAVLESHGWTIHRIWSTDWFQRPGEELKKVLSAIETAKSTVHETTGTSMPLTTETACAVTHQPIQRERPVVNGGDRGLEELAEPYKETWFDVPCGLAPHEVPTCKMAEVVLQIVQDEGPIHLDEVTVRVRHLWRLGRAGTRIQDAVSKASRSLIKSGSCLKDGRFLSVPGQFVKVRRRDAVSSPSLRKPELIPPAEIRAAIRLLLCANHSAMKHEIPTAVARMFGFKNTSSQLRDLIDEQTTRLLHEQVIAEDVGMIKMNVSYRSSVPA